MGSADRSFARHTARLELTCDLSAPGHARDFCARTVTAALAGRSSIDNDAVYDVVSTVVLVASELVTNAIAADCAHVSVQLDVRDARLEVAVYDDAPGGPTLVDAGPNDVHGRGLTLVAALAQRWGVEPADGGKWVWADIALPLLRPAAGAAVRAVEGR